MPVRHLALLTLLLGALLPSLGSGTAWANKGRAPGVASMELTLDGAEVQIVLTVAQEALLGWRGAPQSDEERRVAEELLAWIRQGDQIARLESSAPCSFLRALVQAPALELALHRTVLPPGQSASQSDITVRAVYACATMEAPTVLRTPLFASFRRLERIDVQASLPHGNVKGALRRGAESMSLAKESTKDSAKDRKRARSPQ